MMDDDDKRRFGLMLLSIITIIIAFASYWISDGWTP